MYKFGTVRKPFVYFILGGPGSGKGTQCELLSQNLKFVHLSAGQLLRNAMDQNGKHKDMILQCINEGRIVPSFVTIGLLEQAIFENTQSDTFLIDGFPRNYENMRAWIENMNQKIQFRKAIHIVCQESVMMGRIQERSKTSGRSDDNMQILQKRFITYRNDTKKIIDYYRNNDQLIEVNGDQQIEDVQRDLLNQLVPASYQLHL